MPANKKKKTALPKSWLNTVQCGDAATVASALPRDLAHTIVTSPPYYRQRDYGTRRQLGNEPAPEQYVARLVEVFRALKPVLNSAGTLWLVLGDKFIDGRLLGMPWKVAIALIDDGWILRSECIWHKPNAMPSSTSSRPTVDHETVFLFSRETDYHYDANAIREPHVTFSEQSRMKGGRKHFGVRGGTPEKGKNTGSNNLHDGRWDQAFHPLGRNKRTVWSIPLSKFRGAHFAVFPEQLVETCIKATCPAKGLVLDPFCGSGTTGAVAKRLGRNYFMIDCSRRYCNMARKRIDGV